MYHITLFAELTIKYVTSCSWEFCMTTRHTSHFSWQKIRRLTVRAMARPKNVDKCTAVWMGTLLLWHPHWSSCLLTVYRPPGVNQHYILYNAQAQRRTFCSWKRLLFAYRTATKFTANLINKHHRGEVWNKRLHKWFIIIIKYSEPCPLSGQIIGSRDNSVARSASFFK